MNEDSLGSQIQELERKIERLSTELCQLKKLQQERDSREFIRVNGITLENGEGNTKV